MANNEIEVLPATTGLIFSIVAVHACVLLLNAIKYLHKHGKKMDKYKTHVFRGCKMAMTDIQATKFLTDHLTFGMDLKMQSLRRLRKGVHFLRQRDANKDEIPTAEEFLHGSHFSARIPVTLSAAEQEYERILEYFATPGHASFYGINLHSLSKSSRLCLEDFPLHLRKTLNRDLDDSLGINIPSLYAGMNCSGSAMHCENGDLDSGNLHRYGAVKYWLFVHPDSNQRLRKVVLRALRLSEQKNLTKQWLPGCGTPLHHKRLMLAPSFLRKWGIKFEINVQRPGDFIYISDGVYHQVVNSGPCIAEAVNMGSAFWSHSAHKWRTCECNTKGKSMYVNRNTDVFVSVNASTTQMRRCSTKDCDATFFNKRMLLLHELTHKGAAMHVCSVCSQSFTGSWQFNRHLQSHTYKEPKSQCSKCEKFVVRNFLRVHTVNCRGASLTCPNCAKHFSAASKLTLHLPKCPSRS